MMSVNMSGIDKNPFRVGDKVKVKRPVLRAFPDSFKCYLPVQYAVVTHIDGNIVFTDVDDAPTHFEHFELYKEPEVDVMTKPDTQQKTKRVRFTHELWEKWKDKGGKVIHVPTDKQVMQIVYFPEADHRYHYVYLTTPGTVTSMGTCDPLDIEIPVTTKRIPFNPELKNAKVFYGKTELIEWFHLRTGLVCGTHEWAASFKGMESSLYYSSDLEMEIEGEGV